MKLASIADMALFQSCLLPSRASGAIICQTTVAAKGGAA